MITSAGILTGGVIDAIAADFDGRDAWAEPLVAQTLVGGVGDQHHVRRRNHLTQRPLAYPPAHDTRGGGHGEG